MLSVYTRAFVLAALASALFGCDPADGGEEGGVVIEGRWVGDLESGYLPSGSSMIAVEIERARAGEPVVARVVFGEGQAPTAPTDPEVGWPTGLDPFIGAVPVADGFVYHARGGTRTAERARIELGVTDLWAPWCALQTAYPITAGTDESLCLPNRPWTATSFECHLDEDDTNPETPVECLKLTLCRRARVCDCRAATGCTASPSGLVMSLELNVEGNTAVGAFTWNIAGTMSAGTARVRLTRR